MEIFYWFVLLIDSLVNRKHVQQVSYIQLLFTAFLFLEVNPVLIPILDQSLNFPFPA